MGNTVGLSLDTIQDFVVTHENLKKLLDEIEPDGRAVQNWSRFSTNFYHSIEKQNHWKRMALALTKWDDTSGVSMKDAIEELSAYCQFVQHDVTNGVLWYLHLNKFKCPLEKFLHQWDSLRNYLEDLLIFAENLPPVIENNKTVNNWWLVMRIQRTNGGLPRHVGHPSGSGGATEYFRRND